METNQAIPVFDFNSIFSAVLTQAINQVTAPLLARIELLERSLVVADKAAQGNESDLASRIALLEDKFDNIEDTREERIKEIAQEVADEAITDHATNYDHDMYDRLEDKIDDKVSDAIDEYDFEDKVKDVLTNTLKLTVRVD